MPTSEKDRLAAKAMDRWQDFQLSLSSEKRRYPIQQFRAFWTAATQYAESIAGSFLVSGVEYHADGTISKFAATFEQLCDDS